MPVTKQTLSRYQIINTCLRSRGKKYWSINELLEKLRDYDIEISERTLKEDFGNMRTNERLGYIAPIVWCSINRGYYYEDPTYSINPMTLTHEEIEALHTAAELLRPFEQLSLFQEFLGPFERFRGRSTRHWLISAS